MARLLGAHFATAGLALAQAAHLVSTGHRTGARPLIPLPNQSTHLTGNVYIRVPNAHRITVTPRPASSAVSTPAQWPYQNHVEAQRRQPQPDSYSDAEGAASCHAYGHTQQPGAARATSQFPPRYLRAVSAPKSTRRLQIPHENSTRTPR